MIIYKITNIKDGKSYIGQTTQKLSERWWQHCNRSPSQKHRSYIYNAIQKDGIDSFVIEELDRAGTLEALNLLEIYYVAKFNTMAPNGYNLHPGGKGKKCHPETKVKISNALKGRPIKDRMNGAPKGRAVSEDRRKRISKTMKGVPQPWKYKAVIELTSGAVYHSIQSAEKATGVHRAIIHKLLQNGKTHKRTGTSFKLVDNKAKELP